MLRLVGRSLALALLLVFVVSTLVFVLQAFVPGDAARSILGAGGTPEQIEALRQKLGLDQPVFVRYLDYIGGVLQGDFGTSLANGLRVTDVIAQRLPVTLSLVVLGVIVATTVGVALGVGGAVRSGVTGRLIDILSLAGLALPNFWVALVLVSIFAIAVPLFPATGYVPIGDGFGRWLLSLTLPVLALAFSSLAIVAKTTRDGMLDALNRDSVRMLRSNGISEGSIIWKHALKNAAVPILSSANLVFIGSLGGSVLVENVFALNGLGTLMVGAVTSHEVFIIQGIAIAFTILVVIVNLVVDVAYGWVNPKVRLAQ